MVRGVLTMLVLGGAALFAVEPKVHRLEATPSTVAYGWYDAAGTPVLRIASGDILDVDTLLTNTSTGLARAGVADDQIQASLKAITVQVPREKRGPCGHIVTRPGCVYGAQPADAREGQSLSI